MQSSRITTSEVPNTAQVPTPAASPTKTPFQDLYAATVRGSGSPGADKTLPLHSPSRGARKLRHHLLTGETVTLEPMTSPGVEVEVCEAPEVLRARQRSMRAKLKAQKPIEVPRKRLRHKQPCDAYGAGRLREEADIHGGESESGDSTKSNGYLKMPFKMVGEEDVKTLQP
eukprot:symbB.v1.2.008572.t2/scaffold511.1/size325556/19